MFVVLSQRLLESDLYHEDLQEHLNNFCYFVSEIDWVSVGFSKDFKPRRGKLFNIIFSSLFSWKSCLWEWTGNLNFLSYQCGLGIDWHNWHLELQIKFLEIEEECLYYERILFGCFVVVFLWNFVNWNLWPFWIFKQKKMWKNRNPLLQILTALFM